MYKKFFKRFFDFTLSLICIIILLPVYLIVAILVRIKLGSPVIFRQIRPGKNGKLFTMYKFRSMTNAKDENGNLLPDAERLTKFGKFLRSTSLDELPQLFNILKGDMSIVGPRPRLFRDMVFFDEIIMKRQSIRPGLTGLAQVNGRNDNTWEQTFRYDLEYVEKYNLWMDIKIILRTVVSVIRRDHIDPVEKDRMKESVFNIIGPYFQGETVLDLFGGSGALSFEAISRGASFAVIVEKDYKAYQIIQSNQKLLELTREEVLTLNMDYRDGIKYVKSKNMQFDLVFLDLPYRMHIINELLETLLKENLVKKKYLYNLSL